MTSDEAATSLTVLFVTSMHPSPRFPLRGVIVERHAEALRARGHRVEFVQLGVGGSWRYLWSRRRTRRAIATVRPHVIHVHFGYSGLAVPRTSIPIVCTFYGDDLNGTATRSGRLTWKSRIGILISHFVAWRSTRCITVSESLRSRLWTAALRSKTTVIRDAVDPAVFRPIPRAEARAHLDLSESEVLVLFPHAADVATKRVWLAEAAVRRLQRTVPAARLWVVNGRPPDEMPWYYGAADVMIVTSVLEGGPSSVKEALACGLPVVSVAVGDTKLFEEAPEAMRRAGADPESLAEALTEVLRTAGARRTLLPDTLTLSRAAQSLEDVYRQMVVARPDQGVFGRNA